MQYTCIIPLYYELSDFNFCQMLLIIRLIPQEQALKSWSWSTISSLVRGIRPMRWEINSSIRTEVFCWICTQSIANVHTWGNVRGLLGQEASGSKSLCEKLGSKLLKMGMIYLAKSKNSSILPRRWIFFEACLPQKGLSSRL